MDLPEVTGQYFESESLGVKLRACMIYVDGRAHGQVSPCKPRHASFRLPARGKKKNVSPVDLVFGSNFRLTAFAEACTCADAKKKFLADFAAVLSKVIELDCLDLQG